MHRFCFLPSLGVTPRDLAGCHWTLGPGPSSSGSGTFRPCDWESAGPALPSSRSGVQGLWFPWCGENPVLQPAPWPQHLWLENTPPECCLKVAMSFDSLKPFNYFYCWWEEAQSLQHGMHGLSRPEPYVPVPDDPSDFLHSPSTWANPRSSFCTFLCSCIYIYVACSVPTRAYRGFSTSLRCLLWWSCFLPLFGHHAPHALFYFHTCESTQALKIVLCKWKTLNPCHVVYDYFLSQNFAVIIYVCIYLDF